VVRLYYWPSDGAGGAIGMGIAQTKNLQRRLGVLEQEAVEELNRACGNELWQSVGFDVLDSLSDPDRRARDRDAVDRAPPVRELKDTLG